MGPCQHRVVTPRRPSVRVGILVTLLAATVVVALVVWRRDTPDPCRGVTFHPPGARADPGGPVPPPIGREPRLPDLVRRALRLPRSPLVYCADFADPFVLIRRNRAYAFATNTAAQHVPVLAGGGLLRAARLGDALPRLPAWSKPGNVWAPAVVSQDGRYLLYYTTTVTATGQQCLSVARAARPAGPYTDTSAAPFLCPRGANAIDPSDVHTPDGRRFLLWATYGPRTPHQIVSAELTATGDALAGPPVTLIRADQQWEQGVVEGPSMLATGGRYHLIYSGSFWETAAYAIGSASCAGPQGPCTKHPGPWVAGAGRVQGPGGGELFLDGDGRPWVVFHAWVGPVGYPEGARRLFVARVDLDGPSPVLVVP